MSKKISNIDIKLNRPCGHISTYEDIQLKKVCLQCATEEDIIDETIIYDTDNDLLNRILTLEKSMSQSKQYITCRIEVDKDDNISLMLSCTVKKDFFISLKNVEEIKRFHKMYDSYKTFFSELFDNKKSSLKFMSNPHYKRKYYDGIELVNLSNKTKKAKRVLLTYQLLSPVLALIGTILFILL